MSVVRRKLLALSIVLPTLALGAFTLAPPAGAACEPGPAWCCYAGEYYSIGTCRTGDCWWWSGNKCEQGGVDAYWTGCEC